MIFAYVLHGRPKPFAAMGRARAYTVYGTGLLRVMYMYVYIYIWSVKYSVYNALVVGCHVQTMC